MPSKDSIPFKITLETKNELNRIKKIVADEFGIEEVSITYKQAETILRTKANNGKVTTKQINDILIGKIK